MNYARNPKRQGTLILLLLLLAILPVLFTTTGCVQRKPSAPIVVWESKEVTYIAKGAIDANTPPWDAVIISKGRYLELVGYEMLCIENGLKP